VPVYPSKQTKHQKSAFESYQNKTAPLTSTPVVSEDVIPAVAVVVVIVTGLAVTVEVTIVVPADSVTVSNKVFMMTVVPELS
jgi:hypothetical protein